LEILKIENMDKLNEVEINNCKQLRKIMIGELRNLSKVKVNSCSALEKLEINSDSFFDEHPIQEIDLKGCSSLLELDLSSFENLKKLIGLDTLLNLKKLNLSSSKYLNLNELIKNSIFQNMTELILCDNKKLDSLKFINQFPELIELDVSNCNLIRNLKLIRKHNTLNKLNLSYCESLEDISDIEKLSNLNELEISDNKKLVDFSPISKIKNLTKLECYSNNFKNLKFLSGSRSLKILNCSSNEKLLSTSGIENITTLEELDLSSNEKLTDISGVKYLRNLRELNLSYCESLMDFLPVSHLKNLTKIDLSSNEQLNDIEHLKYLRNLKELNINGCFNIPSFEPLINCLNLEEIYFENKGLVASILTETALKRKDLEFINNNIKEWLGIFKPIVYTEPMGSRLISIFRLLLEVEILNKENDNNTNDEYIEEVDLSDEAGDDLDSIFSDADENSEEDIDSDEELEDTEVDTDSDEDLEDTEDDIDSDEDLEDTEVDTDSDEELEDTDDDIDSDEELEDTDDDIDSDEDLEDTDDDIDSDEDLEDTDDEFDSDEDLEDTEDDFDSDEDLEDTEDEFDSNEEVVELEKEIETVNINTLFEINIDEADNLFFLASAHEKEIKSETKEHFSKFLDYLFIKKDLKIPTIEYSLKILGLVADKVFIQSNFENIFDKQLKYKNGLNINVMISYLAEPPLQYKVWADSLVERASNIFKSPKEISEIGIGTTLYYVSTNNEIESDRWLNLITINTPPITKDRVLLSLSKFALQKGNSNQSRKYSSQLAYPEVRDEFRIMYTNYMIINNNLDFKQIHEFLLEMETVMGEENLALYLTENEKYLEDDERLFAILIALERNPEKMYEFINKVINKFPDKDFINIIMKEFSNTQESSGILEEVTDLIEKEDLKQNLRPKDFIKLKEKINDKTYLNKILYKGLLKQLIDEKYIDIEDANNLEKSI
jgi:Leucine-rich repeat (LRR) protein